MKKLLFIVLAFAFNFTYAQQNKQLDSILHDPMARKILDRVSNRYSAYKTLRLYFQYQVYDNKDTTNRIKQKYFGWLYVSGNDKYKLIIPDIEIFSDGVKIYSFDKKNKEMNITFYDPQSTDILTPQKLLYIYKKGFKYSYRGYARFNTKKAVNGKVVPKLRTMYIIDLYPDNPKKSPYSLVRLWIDKTNYQIVSVKYQGKNGIDIVVDILEEKPNIPLAASMFMYDPKKLPKGTEVNDFTQDD